MGDFEWFNNINWFLFWVFNDLKELIDICYLGIFFNVVLFMLGDVLLLELINGEYLFVKVVVGCNSLSWL